MACAEHAVRDRTGAACPEAASTSARIRAGAYKARSFFPGVPDITRTTMPRANFLLSYVRPVHGSLKDGIGEVPVSYPMRFSIGVQQQTFYDFPGPARPPRCFRLCTSRLF